MVFLGRCEIVSEDTISITLRALHVERGTVIYQDTQNELIGGGPEDMEQIIQQLERAINSVALRFVPEIINAMEMPEVSVNKLIITLNGLQSFKQFRNFWDFLNKNVNGVQAVAQTRVGANSISVSVEFSGDREGFLATVLNHEAFPFSADGSETDEGGIVIHIKGVRPEM